MGLFDKVTERQREVYIFIRERYAAGATGRPSVKSPPSSASCRLMGSFAI